MSAVSRIAFWSAAAIAAWMGFKAGVGPSEKTAPVVKDRPVVGESFKRVAPAKVVTVATFDTRSVEAARKFAGYAEMFGVNPDGSNGPGLVALRKVVDALKTNPLFASAELEATFTQLEAAARGIKTDKSTTLSGYSDADIVASMKDGGSGAVYYRALQEMSFRLHAGRNGEVAKMIAAERAFKKAAKSYPELAGLSIIVDLAYRHYEFSRSPSTSAFRAYSENTARLETELAAVRKVEPRVIVETAPRIEKEVKAAPVVADVFTAIDTNASAVLRDGNVHASIAFVKREMVRITGVDTVESDYQKLLRDFARLGSNPKSHEALYDAAVDTRAVLMFLTSVPQYEGFMKAHPAHKRNIDKAIAAYDSFLKDSPYVNTRCGGRIKIRGVGCRL